MRQLARTIINPTHGYSTTFLKSTTETGGAYTLVEVVLPAGEGTPMHYHLDFTEEFSAVEGTLGIQLGKKVVHLQPGDAPALAPKRVHHRFFNPGTTPIRFRCVVRPSRRFEDMLRIVYGLAHDGLMNKKGLPKNLLTLAICYEIGESYVPGMPLWLQRGIFRILAQVARRRGADKDLERYYVGTLVSEEHFSAV